MRNLHPVLKLATRHFAPSYHVLTFKILCMYDEYDWVFFGGVGGGGGVGSSFIVKVTQ